MNEEPIAVLGGTGQIGRRIAGQLLVQGRKIRLISRQPRLRVSWANHDLVDWRQIDDYGLATIRRALDGVDSVVASLGLPYKSEDWLREWPTLTSNAVGAVSDLRIRLTWLDNLYMYGLPPMPISEQSPMEPITDMGRARAAALSHLATAREQGVDIATGRAADFLGEGINTSILPWNSITTALKGPWAGVLPWLGSATAKHSFASGDDVAAGLIRLNDIPLRDELVYHLPTLKSVTGVEVAASLGRLSGKRIGALRLPVPLLHALGVLSGPLKEQAKMSYLTTSDFIVDDSRFRRLFPDFEQRTVEDVLEEHALLQGKSRPEKMCG